MSLTSPSPASAGPATTTSPSACAPPSSAESRDPDRAGRRELRANAPQRFSIGAPFSGKEPRCTLAPSSPRSRPSPDPRPRRSDGGRAGRRGRGPSCPRPPPTGPARRSPTSARSSRATGRLTGAPPTHAHRDATLALRDLMRVRDRLTGAERRAADAYLARPASSQKSCTTRICVHYTPSNVSPDGPDRNRISDYVDKCAGPSTASTGTTPRPATGRRRPTAVVAATTRPTSTCATSGPRVSTATAPARSGSRRPGRSTPGPTACSTTTTGSSPTQTRLDNMRVTAAHEYFHAVQFAYDALEDGWFMEATATWAEDELFDSIDDNRQFLRRRTTRSAAGPARQVRGGRGPPLRRLDLLPVPHRAARRRGRPAAAGPRDVAPGRRLGHRARTCTPWRRSSRPWPSGAQRSATRFALFADGNRRPATTYDEGAAYPTVPAVARRTLTPTSPVADLTVDQLDHQTSATARFTPSGLAEGWELQIQVDMASPEPRVGGRGHLLLGRDRLGADPGHSGPAPAPAASRSRSTTPRCPTSR